MNNFCPLINASCNTNCVFIEEKTGYLQIVKKCSLAEAVKNSENRPDAELLIELKKLVNKI